MATTPESAARFAKTLRIVSVIDAAALAEGIDPHAEAEAIAEGLENPTSRFWRTAALCAGKRPPSDETRKMVCEVFAARVQARRLVPLLAAANV